MKEYRTTAVISAEDCPDLYCVRVQSVAHIKTISLDIIASYCGQEIYHHAVKSTPVALFIWLNNAVSCPIIPRT